MKNFERETWLYKQSAVVPYRAKNGKIEILLITSRKGRWIIPKGIIEPELTAAESAAKEALEEAGVAGNLHARQIGEYEYSKWGGTCHVKVFLLEVTRVFDAWEESYFRSRKWLPVEKAAAAVSDEVLRTILKKVPQLIRAKAAGRA